MSPSFLKKMVYQVPYRSDTAAMYGEQKLYIRKKGKRSLKERKKESKYYKE